MMKGPIGLIASVALAMTLVACDKHGANQGAATNTAAADASATPAAASLDAMNGTWKADINSVTFEGKPNHFVLKDGQYECDSCMPPLKLVADGQFHPVTDRPYYDSMSMRVVDPKTVELVRRKGGKVVGNATISVSDDGQTLTQKFSDMSISPTVEGSNTAKRVGAPVAGAHAISGSWAPDKMKDYSADALTMHFAVAGNKVTMTGAGESYVAELGGAAVAMQNDPGGTMVAVARDGASGLKETMSRGGKTVSVNTYVPSADGKTMTATSVDPRDGSKSHWTAAKQG